jgi:hypothetical protein
MQVSPDRASPYEATLGERFQVLHPHVRRAHQAPLSAEGAMAYLLPELLQWRQLPTGWGESYHGFPAWVLSGLAVGVFVSGVRDALASRRPA